MQQVRAIDAAKPGELRRWASFTAACFSEKANPPSAAYFEDKVRADPFCLLEEDVRVIQQDASGEIIAALRVFHRVMALPSESGGELRACAILGIGEVGVAQAHRGQGLANVLLDSVLAPNQVALLHASLVSARKTYAKSGFVSIPPMKLYSLPLPMATALPQNAPRLRTITLVDLAQDALVVCNLYAKYLAKAYPGAFERTREYCKKWVIPRWLRKGCAFVTADSQCYLYLLRRPAGWQVEEYAGPFRLFPGILSQALQAVEPLEGLLISGALYEFLFHASAEDDRLKPMMEDDGWMLRGVSDPSVVRYVFDSDSF